MSRFAGKVSKPVIRSIHDIKNLLWKGLLEQRSGTFFNGAELDCNENEIFDETNPNR
jgi:hypothetical protein